MARPKKQTVDYFPHQCNHGKTMFILEQRYGNDGYSFWFKLLETIGTSEGHFIDCKNEEQWEFLLAKTRLESAKGLEILDLLAKLEAINRELWLEHRVVWSDNFIDGVKEAYRNRTVKIPDRPSFQRKKSDESKDNLPQKSTNEMKVNEMKVNENTGRRKFVPPMLEQVQEYCQRRKNGIDPEAFMAHYTANGWVQGKGKPIRDWKAAVVTWEKNQSGGKNNANGRDNRSFFERDVEQREQAKRGARALLGVLGGGSGVAPDIHTGKIDRERASAIPGEVEQIPEVEAPETG